MPTLTILHGCRTLQLSRGLNTLIDEADFEIVGRFKWNARPAHNGLGFYAVRNIKAKINTQESVKLHRALIETPENVLVDHWNGDKLDNRRMNLRPASPSQNTQNTRRSVGESRFKGVSRAGTSWRARIRVNGQLMQLGCHRTQEAAARAYDEAARKYFGEFACTNVDLRGEY